MSVLRLFGFDLTKRCSYLFAALTDSVGIIPSNLFETPQPHPQIASNCITYSLLWNVTLLEYLKDTHDMGTAWELWPVAKRQVENVWSLINNQNLFDSRLMRLGEWLFLDHRTGSDFSVAAQGAVIHGIQQTIELANLVGHSDEVKGWHKVVSAMKKAARKHLYDAKNKMFISLEQGQKSLLSQI